MGSEHVLPVLSVIEANIAHCLLTLGGFKLVMRVAK